MAPHASPSLLHLSLLLLALALPKGEALAANFDLAGSELSLRVWVGGGVDVPLAAQGPDPLTVSVSSAGGFGLPPALFDATATIPTAVFTGVPFFSSIRLDLSNASQSFAPGGGPGAGFGGAGALQGTAFLGVAGALGFVPIPLGGVGVGGAATAVQAAALVFSATGGQWTTGPAAITGVAVPTNGGGFLNTVSLSGSDGRSAGHAGTLQLVAPMRILSNAVVGVPLFFTQTLRFVPEPGTALLFGVGALFAGVLGLGRRR